MKNVPDIGFEPVWRCSWCTVGAGAEGMGGRGDFTAEPEASGKRLGGG